MSKKITTQELEESLQYLEAFAKGKEISVVDDNNQPSENQSQDEEPDDELYSAHKNRMSYYLDKAMSHKGFMDKIKKGDPLPDEAFDDLDDEGDSDDSVEQKPNLEAKMQKGRGNELNSLNEDVEALVKAKVQEELKSTKLEYEGIIKGLQDEIKELKDQPVRKTLIKGADAVVLKKALSGEKEEGKVVLSVSLQKGKVSEALYQAYEDETNDIVKGKLSEAVAQFESTGHYLSAETLQIMDDKGYKFIK